MKLPNAPRTPTEPFDTSRDTFDVRDESAPEREPTSLPILAATKTPPGQIALLVLDTIALLYFARPVVLPIFLACVAAVTLKPIIRWSSRGHIPPPLSSAVVLGVLVSALGIGFFQLGRPALTWINRAPQHMTELRQKVQNILPPRARFTEAAAAVNNLGATEEEKAAEQKLAPMVEVKDSRGTSSILN